MEQQEQPQQEPQQPVAEVTPRRKRGGLASLSGDDLFESLGDVAMSMAMGYPVALMRRRERAGLLRERRRSRKRVIQAQSTPQTPPTAEPVVREDMGDSSCCERVRDMVEGIIKSIESITSEIESAKASISTIGEAIKNISTARTADLRPQTIEMAGKQFIYYPGAPEGRQFYEKTAEGKAGADAPRGMKEALQRKVEQSPQPSVNYTEIIQRTTDNNMRIVERMLAQELPNQESQIADLLKKIAMKESGALGIEMDEQEEMLARAMEKALNRVLPRVLQESGGGTGGPGSGGGGGSITDLASATPVTSGGFGGSLRPDAPTGGRRGILGKIGGLISRTGITKLGGKSMLTKLPVGLGLLAGLGFGAKRAMAGDYTGAAMEVGSGAASIVPGIGTAASLGIDATLAARDSGLLTSVDNTVNNQSTTLKEVISQPPVSRLQPIVTKTNAPMSPMVEMAQAEPVIRSTAERIIEMTRQVMMTGKSSGVAIPQQPTVINNITNNRVAPSVKIPDEEQSGIRVFPMENTFNRLVAQDYEHPSTYNSLVLG